MTWPSVRKVVAWLSGTGRYIDLTYPIQVVVQHACLRDFVQSNQEHPSLYLCIYGVSSSIWNSWGLCDTYLLLEL